MSSDAPIIGRTLGGRFRVLAFIGEGGMASVYRAEQQAEPREVALKILHPHLVSDATFVGRFRREARAATRVVHPSSVQIIDTGVDGKLLYIAMELLTGQDLFEILVLERRLTERRAVAIVAEVADALAAAHAQGVIHRDLKPENIMLVDDPASTPHETVKVLDFGIAKILERDFKTSSDGLPSMYPALTGVDTVIGTPAYMSPEQCRGEPVDHTSDIYACGVLLYQLLSGRVPFTAASTMEVAVMHVRTPPLPLASLVPSVNPKLAEIVERALAKWPNERQQSAAALRDELRAILPVAADHKLANAEAPATAVVVSQPSGEDRVATLARERLSSSEDRETIPADARVGAVVPAHVPALDTESVASERIEVAGVPSRSWPLVVGVVVLSVLMASAVVLGVLVLTRG